MDNEITPPPCESFKNIDDPPFRAVSLAHGNFQRVIRDPTVASDNGSSTVGLLREPAGSVSAGSSVSVSAIGQDQGLDYDADAESTPRSKRFRVDDGRYSLSSLASRPNRGSSRDGYYPCVDSRYSSGSHSGQDSSHF